MASKQLKKLQVQFCIQHDDQVIEGIYNSAIESKNNLSRKLKEQLEDIKSDNFLSLDDKLSLAESLSDDYFLSERTTELASEMLIVAFYKTIELEIKDMLIFSELCSNVKKISTIDKIGLYMIFSG
jgi:hypothetical protein